MSVPQKSSSTPLRVGLLGAGVISAPHALALQNVPHARLVAVCDTDAAKAQALGRKWRVNSIFDSLPEMLSQASLDVVHVLLPPTAHADASIACLRAGAHVFVEKPFCISARECALVQEAAAKNGRRAGVNHNLTYMPGILRLLEEVRSWRLGAIEHVTVAYNLLMPALAAGQHGHWMFGSKERLMLELGPHPLSVICRLLGPVTASATALDGHWDLTNGQSFYDTWQTSLVCERGTAQMLLSVGREYLNTWVHVIGQDGEAFVDLRRNTVRISEKTKYIRIDNLVDAWRNSRDLMTAGLSNFGAYVQGALGLKPAYELQNLSVGASVSAFYEALVTGGDFPASAAEGTAVVEACESIIESGSQFIESQGAHSNAVYR
jgi:predicted dehydrogenase